MRGAPLEYLQFVNQVVPEVLRDVLVPAFSHAGGRGRAGCGHGPDPTGIIQ